MGGKGPLKKLISFFKKVKCYIRIIGNFYKCIVFYLLDILKYWIFFLPVLLYSIIHKTNPIKNMQAINYITRWDNKTMYQCYLCKRKKKKGMSYWKKLLMEAFGKGKNNISSHAFFYFFLLITAISVCIAFFPSSTDSAKKSVDTSTSTQTYVPSNQI